MTDRWEQGSSFDLPDRQPADTLLPGLGRLLGTCISGRGALVRILQHALEPGARVWMPGYYCPEVRAAVREMFDNELLAFPDSPRSPDMVLPSAVSQRDVVVVQNLFGLRQQPDYRGLHTAGAIVIEDHTHDPSSRWAASSQAEYAFASLRKTLPLPDGAVVWSRRTTVPLPVAHNRPALLEAVVDRLKAMLLKGDYLAGSEFLTQGSYRVHERPLKREICLLPHGPMTGISAALLSTLPTGEYADIRRRNAAFLTGQLRSAGLTVLEPAVPDPAPMAVIVDLEDNRTVRRAGEALKRQRVYLSVLWEDAEADGETGFSAEHLAIRCDHRYSTDDLARVAAILASCG